MLADVLAPLQALRGGARGALDGTVDALHHRNGAAAVLALRNEGRGGRVGSVITADGLALHTETDPPTAPTDRPAVVFVHGYSLDLTNWREQRAALRGELELVLYDQRGFGRTARGDVPGTMRLLASDLADVVASVGRPVVLVGHSMGVMVVTALAGLRPDLFGTSVVGTVLVAGNAGELRASEFGMGAYVAPAVHAVGLRALQGLAKVPGLDRVTTFGEYMAIAGMFMCDASATTQMLRVCASMTSQNRLDVLAEYAAAMYAHDEVAALPVLGRVPCAVLAAAQDRFIPSYHTEQLAREIPGATLEVVEACGHMIPVEHPDVVTGAIRRAVDQA